MSVLTSVLTCCLRFVTPLIMITVNLIKSSFASSDLVSLIIFLVKGQLYDQIDGVAMGSPLGPSMANILCVLWR